jgi:HEAT repeat protein
VEALRSDSAEARKKAARALWQIGGPAVDATPALVAAAKDPDPGVRAAAVRALGRTSPKLQSVIPPLVEALADGDEGVRAAAATALGEIWAEDRQTGSRSARLRLSPPAEEAARPAIQPLMTVLRDKNPEVRGEAAWALSETGPLAEPALGELTRVAREDPAEKARLYSAIALGNIGPPARTAVPVLLDRLRHDKVDGIRANTATALGQIHCDADEVVPALVHMLLTEKFGDVRAAALQGLRAFGRDARPAVAVLQAAAAENQGNPQRLEEINGLLQYVQEKLLKEPGAAPEKPPSRQPKRGARR